MGSSPGGGGGSHSHASSLFGLSKTQALIRMMDRTIRQCWDDYDHYYDVQSVLQISCRSAEEKLVKFNKEAMKITQITPQEGELLEDLESDLRKVLRRLASRVSKLEDNRDNKKLAPREVLPSWSGSCIEFHQF